MAKINPKLEFYRFTLNHKNKRFSTFKEFIENKLKKANLSDETAMGMLFKHFTNSLKGSHAKDDKLKKQIKLEKRSNINKYLDNQPRFIIKNHIICGVINGGSYGTHRILSDIENPEESTQLGQKKAVMPYYFFLLYLPLEHNEGCFIIQSNSREDTITDIFRKFVSNVFKGKEFRRPIMEIFCPKSFQDEFRKGAVIQNLKFIDKAIDDIHNANETTETIGEFDVKIEIIPRDKKIPISISKAIKSLLAPFSFGKKEKYTKLNDFDRVNLTVKNPVDNSTRTFEWNNKDNDFVPVIYLKERMKKFNEDDTPNFVELEKLCINYLENKVLPDLRQDSYVTKAK